MKFLFTGILATSIALTLFSCTKKGAAAAMWAGTWEVVSDSSVNTNKLYTLSENENGVASSNYAGEQCPATFSFHSDGTLITSFFNCLFGGPTVDSARYLQSANQITISILAQCSGACSTMPSVPVVTRTYTISQLTAYTATLSFGAGSGDQSEVIVWRSKSHCKLWARRRWKDEKT